MAECKHEVVYKGFLYSINDRAKNDIEETLASFDSVAITATATAIPTSKASPKWETACKKVVGMLDPNKGIPRKLVKEIIDTLGG